MKETGVSNRTVRQEKKVEIFEIIEHSQRGPKTWFELRIGGTVLGESESLQEMLYICCEGSSHCRKRPKGQKTWAKAMEVLHSLLRKDW